MSEDSKIETCVDMLAKHSLKIARELQMNPIDVSVVMMEMGIVGLDAGGVPHYAIKARTEITLAAIVEAKAAPAENPPEGQ